MERCATIVDPKLHLAVSIEPFRGIRLICALPRILQLSLVTKPDVTKQNVITASQEGAHVVIGASGLTADDLAEIDGEAKQRQRGVLAVGNFALTAVLLLKFAEVAAKLISHWEIIDYAHDDRVDAPSGTVRDWRHAWPGHASRRRLSRSISPLESGKPEGRP